MRIKKEGSFLGEDSYQVRICEIWLLLGYDACWACEVAKPDAGAAAYLELESSLFS